MKYFITIALSALFCIGANAQNDSVSLLPDQNPNFQRSRAKYMEQSAELTKNQGQTVQDTYKAIDDVQAKKERKELAAARRHERRMARIMSRGYGYGGYYNNGYGYGYNNYGYNNYGYGYNNYGYNNGYYGNPYPNYGYGNPWGGYYRPRFWGGPAFGAVNSAIGTALLGLTLWHVLKH